MSDTEQSGEELVDVGPQPRRYTEAEVRERVAKAHEYCANKWQDYEYPYRFFMELAADIRSGKESI